MDKILLSALIGLVAAMVAAAAAFAKLITDKEGKVSEFRQQWTVDVRSSFAETVALFRRYFSLVEGKYQNIDACNDIDKVMVGLSKDDPKRDYFQGLIDHGTGRLDYFKSEISKVEGEIYRNLTVTLLHFKQNANEMALIEGKLDLLLGLMSEADRVWDASAETQANMEKLQLIRGRSEVLCSEITLLFRVVLKQEWDRIKVGEPGYKSAKNVFKFGAILGGVIIGVIFVVMLVSERDKHVVDQYIKSHGVETPVQAPAQAPLKQ